MRHLFNQPCQCCHKAVHLFMPSVSGCQLLWLICIAGMLGRHLDLSFDSSDGPNLHRSDHSSVQCVPRLHVGSGFSGQYDYTQRSCVDKQGPKKEGWGTDVKVRCTRMRSFEELHRP